MERLLAVIAGLDQAIHLLREMGLFFFARWAFFTYRMDARVKPAHDS
jgi:hypothetical protein